MRRARDGVDGLIGNGAGRVSYQGAVRTSGQYARTGAVAETTSDRIARCVGVLFIGGLRCVVFEWRCASGRRFPAPSAQLLNTGGGTVTPRGLGRITTRSGWWRKAALATTFAGLALTPQWLQLAGRARPRLAQGVTPEAQSMHKLWLGSVIAAR